MPNQPLRRAGIARIPLRVVILVIVALAALAATGCGDDDGTGPMERLGDRHAGARFVGTWAWQPTSGMTFPGMAPGSVVVADTLRIAADGTVDWRLLVAESSGRALPGALGMLWEVRHDSLLIFTSCSRDPACFTSVPNWVGVRSGTGQLALHLHMRSVMSVPPRHYLREEAPR